MFSFLCKTKTKQNITLTCRKLTTSFFDKNCINMGKIHYGCITVFGKEELNARKKVVFCGVGS